MKAFNIISAICLALSTLGVAAQKDPQARPVKPRAEAGRVSRPEAGEKFKHFDTNADGQISRKEASPRLRENFDRLDQTKDGFITQREFRAVQAGKVERKPAPGAAPEEAFKRFDANDDGQISRKEAPPRLRENFDRFDQTKDGFITQREFRAAQAGKAERKGAPGEAPDTAFKRFDANGDGKISRKEAPPRLQENFDRFDQTKDGFITPRELNAGRAPEPAPKPERPLRRLAK